MAKIVKMDATLANLIAAGEVVEKPSSVVKELVENAIDANAKQINVSLKECGLVEIRVTDDGDGMNEEDVCLAFLRHATSKIKTEYDLSRIKTLGFRGEAIPSIAAVSLMQICTNDGMSGGYQSTYKGGNIQSQGPLACKKGTTVTVNNLFYNTPARLKYIKSPTKELASIVFIMNKFALTHPDISFTLSNNERELIRTSGNSDYHQLFGEIYGLNVAKNIKVLDFEADGCKVKVVFAKPEIYRSSKLDITLVTNGRYVRSNAVNQAIMDAYYTQLPIGKAPIVTIYLDIDPLLTDVNVHPTKIEIKISNEENICEQLRTNLKKELEGTVQIPQREVETPKAYQKEAIFEEKIVETKVSEPIIRPILEKESFVEEKSIIEEKTPVEVKQPTKDLEEPKSKLPYMEYIGQALGCYLIFQNQNGIYLMDQHAAAERIKYEYFSKLLNAKEQPSSALLFPIEIDIPLDEALILKEHMDVFSSLKIKLGVEDKRITVHEIPMWLEVGNAEDVVRQIITLLSNNRKFDVLYFRDVIAKQISCKSAIRANRRVSRDEVDALLKELSKCQNPYHCPHGRPTIITLTNEELEKMFERIVA